MDDPGMARGGLRRGEGDRLSGSTVVDGEENEREGDGEGDERREIKIGSEGMSEEEREEREEREREEEEMREARINRKVSPNDLPWSSRAVR
jgi:hypothetical protein